MNPPVACFLRIDEYNSLDHATPTLQAGIQKQCFSCLLKPL